MKLLLLACLFGLTACAASQSDSRTPTTVVPADPAHNSRNSLDWAGRYAAVLPCADCEGIDTVVTLRMDGTFTRQSRYLGKSDRVFTDTGSFEWDASGSAVTLLTKQGAAQAYKVGENQLIHLDQSGRPVTGALAPHYVLLKIR